MRSFSVASRDSVMASKVAEIIRATMTWRYYAQHAAS